MPSAILTDGATFTCPHHGKGTVASGLSISALADVLVIGGHKAILAGAAISGFTAALGCNFTNLATGNPQPCMGFTLPPPSGQAVLVNGQPVYTMADAATIALAPSQGNFVPGLTVSEPQTLVSA
jgi:hypothetical protein